MINDNYSGHGTNTEYILYVLPIVIIPCAIACCRTLYTYTPWGYKDKKAYRIKKGIST